MQPTVSTPKSAARAQRGIQSMEVGGRLLASLTRAGAPMMLKDLAAASGLGAASAHPYLVSLIKLGLVEQDTVSGRYALGPFALEMGLASLRQRDEIRMACEVAAELASDTGLSVAVSVWGNLGATVVRLEPSSRPLHVSLRTGSVLSLVSTATGRVFGAFMPEAVWAPRLALDAQAVGGSDGRPDLAQARLLFAQVRERGIARAQGEPIPGVNAFCSPVFDQDGALLLAITVLGAAGDLPSQWSSPVASSLGQACDALSGRLGWRHRRLEDRRDEALR